MKNFLIATAMILTATTANAATTDFSIDSVRYNGYHTLIEITVNNSKVRQVDCRGYDNNGRIVGTKTFYLWNGETGWYDGAILNRYAARVQCQAKYNQW